MKTGQAGLSGSKEGTFTGPFFLSADSVCPKRLCQRTRYQGDWLPAVSLTLTQVGFFLDLTLMDHP